MKGRRERRREKELYNQEEVRGGTAIKNTYPAVTNGNSNRDTCRSALPSHNLFFLKFLSKLQKWFYLQNVRIAEIQEYLQY